MSRSTQRLAGVGWLLFAGLHLAAGARQPAAPPIVGRWDITVAAEGGSYPSWLEVQRSGNHAIVGRFVGRSGSARPISTIEFSDGTMRFSIPPQWEQGDRDLHVEGRMEGERLTGWLTDPAGTRLTWTANRAPSLRRPASPSWGKPIALFDGSDMSAWQAATNSQWHVVDHLLSSPKPGVNLVSKQTFNDFKLHVEFRYPKNGNSGVYLRGRYEVQIEDSGGLEPASDHLGGVYGFLPPNEDAAKKPGEWQTYDITLVGRLVTVVLNGKTVIASQEIPGITGGALDSNEGAPGPILLQGDHTAIDYRNIVITPAAQS
jgi:3-keto-disaccharide hydrolase